MVPPRPPNFPPTVNPPTVNPPTMKPVKQPQVESDETVSKSLPIGMVSVSIIFAVLLALVLLLLLKRKPLDSPSAFARTSTEVLAMGATGALSEQPNGSKGDESKQDRDSDQSEPESREATVPRASVQSDTDMQEPGDAGDRPVGKDVEELVLPMRTKRPSILPASKALQSGANGQNPFEAASGTGDVVYVIDCSTSMDGEPFTRVQRSLCDAIQGLKSKQKFTVIFFNNAAVLGPFERGQRAASAKHKREAVDWIRSMFTSGGTEPLDALEIALQLQPHRIVVLSDGEFSPYVVEAVTNLNHQTTRPVRIDCIGLSEQIETLQDLARQNGNGFYHQAR